MGSNTFSHYKISSYIAIIINPKYSFITMFHDLHAHENVFKTENFLFILYYARFCTGKNCKNHNILGALSWWLLGQILRGGRGHNKDSDL